MLQNIKSEREGLWTAHLISVSAMLSYLFNTNRVNYSRWLPVYIFEMLSLPSDIKKVFESGQFAICQKPSAFNGIRQVLADFCSEMRSRSGASSKDDDSHDEAMKRDEEHVKLLIDHLRERMTDPFEVEEHPEALINISTGMHASR